MNLYKLQKIILLRKITLVFAIMFMYVGGFSQIKKGENLVPNPSFEKRKNKSSDIKNAIPWVGIGTVDYYFGKPEKRDTSRYKGARTGVAYGGLRFQSDYKEYMYVPLTEPLKKGRVYHFKMYVRLLDFKNVTVTIKQLGVYFSDKAFTVGMVFDKESIVDSTYKKGLAGTDNWIPIQGNYVAHGGEKFIIIGNFRTKMKDDFVKKNKLKIFEFAEAYYYIDDVSLYETESIAVDTTIPPELQTKIPDSLFVGQTIEIKNIRFEGKSNTILRASLQTLTDIAEMLNNNLFMQVQFNVIDETPKLAKERSQAIANYFKSENVINPITYTHGANKTSEKTTLPYMEIVILKID